MSLKPAAAKSPLDGQPDLQFCSPGGALDARFAYRLGGRRIASNIEFPSLAGYRVAPRDNPRPVRRFPAPRSPLKRIFSGPAFIGNRDRELTFQVGGQVATLSIEGLGTYHLDLGGRRIRPSAPTLPAAAIEQALVGPCLAVVMACGGDFLLHASALRVTGGIVALLGRSGAGKSTLVGELAAATAALAVADDAVPACRDGRRIQVPGAYPQLKWPAWGAGRLADSPASLIAGVVLEPGADGVHMEPMAASDALLAATTHTIAARLFPPRLLKAHFGFCRELADRVPFVRLRYAQQLRNLPCMVEKISSLWTN